MRKTPLRQDGDDAVSQSGKSKGHDPTKDRDDSPLAKATADHEDQAESIRADLWEKALRRAHGNSAAAALDFLGANRQRGHYLTKRHGLQALAKELKAQKKTATKKEQKP